MLPFGALGCIHKTAFSPLRDEKSHKTHYILTSCMHVVHLNCYKEYLQNNSTIICPLCKSTFNLYLPLFADSLPEHGMELSCINDEVHFLQETNAWIQSGGLGRIFRKYENNEFCERDRENAEFGYKSFIEAWRQLNGHNLIDWGEIFESVTCHLCLIYEYSSEYSGCLKAGRIFARAAKLWDSLKLDAYLSQAICDVLERANIRLKSLESNFCDTRGLTKKTSALQELALLLLSCMGSVSHSDLVRLCSIYTLLPAGDDKSVESHEEQIQNMLRIWTGSSINLKKIHSYECVHLFEAVSNWLTLSRRQLTFTESIKYNLTPLPDRLDHLLVKISSVPCNSCGTKPYFPALCLICGALICANSACCSALGIGECNTHVSRYNRIGFS